MPSSPPRMRLRVSPAVAQVAAQNAPRAARLEAARGAFALTGRDRLTALLLLCHDPDAEIRTLAVGTMRGLPAAEVVDLVAEGNLDGPLIDFVVQARRRDPLVREALLRHPALSAAARQALTLAPPGDPRREAEGADSAAPDGPSAVAADGDSLSKYQQSLEFGVSEKIKAALTGDKEWRSILIKEANKLVSAAVLKNPRITEGEVLMVAKNRSSSEELIRLITLNQEWLKNYEIKKALVEHPRTPLAKALRLLAALSEKDLKHLAKSRNVAQVIVNQARRMLTAREQSSR